MKNIDAEKIKRLINLFTDLDKNYQDEAMAYIYTLVIEQFAKKVSVESNQKDVKKTINEKDAVKEIKKDIVETFKNISKLDFEQKAKLAIAMEILKKGSMTKKEEVSVVINSKEISLEEYIAKEFNGVDYNKVKRETVEIMNEMKNKI
jgi:hypothetical protein